jgi:DNA-binding FadR family transcriptional regulator
MYPREAELDQEPDRAGTEAAATAAGRLRPDVTRPNHRPAPANRTVGQQVRVPKTAELVVAHLRRQIVKAELVEGAALPQEAILMAQFGISRPTLREAFRVLEAESLISVRRGAHGGARVHSPNGDVAARYVAAVLEHRGTTLKDLYDARIVMEPACAAMLARRRTSEDVALLRSTVADEQACLDRQQAMREHLRFHSLVVKLAGNATMAVLTDMVRHIIELASLSTVVLAPPEVNQKAFAQGHRAHERLVVLIEDGRPTEAADLWASHLTEAESYLLESADHETVLDLLG